MNPDLSRRDFLAAGLVLPAAGLRARDNLPLPPEGSQASPEPLELTYRSLGKTGLKVTSLGFGCMTTPDPSVIRRAADLGINHFDTARVYQNGNNERMVGVALKDVRQKVILSSKSVATTRAEAGQRRPMQRLRRLFLPIRMRRGSPRKAEARAGSPGITAKKSPEDSGAGDPRPCPRAAGGGPRPSLAPGGSPCQAI